LAILALISIRTVRFNFLIQYAINYLGEVLSVSFI